ncbi:hypothetical protein VOWphi5012_017 [Vibrio phage phi50-12]|uniref:Uncharacterized protein n=1 Tax=Vibrio phage phi50-12 TaxID=2654972 RepID=A0A5P8PSP6_9CAUD|nr:hypothetical protein KNU82_gp017 [Vibrio phage phi50-12]QFR59801.1 hypothetical protein VOWphi5012_017 [Vibrio phage phi50-12]
MAMNNLNFGGNVLDSLSLSNPSISSMGTMPLQNLSFGNTSTMDTGLNFDKAFWLGGENSMGVLPVGAQLFQTGLNAYTGLQGLNLAKEQLAFSKDAFNKNYANQVKLTNAQLRDRQEARYAANPNAYENPDKYMEENKVG